MATSIVNISQSKQICVVDTYNHVTLQSGIYSVSCAINSIPPSGITITIQQNTTTIASTSLPSDSQEVIQLSAPINCAIGDVLGITVTTNVASDLVPNSFKGIINIHPGLP